jgi:nitroimidazol reductase NimA-like FMN-containing flavoprotein (pyridoxamine 5'-phosphate oxidase superfamily)
MPTTLYESQCRRLLQGAVVGRVAFWTPGGLRIMPVNYASVNDAIYFRTSRDSDLGVNAPDAEVAFEVDHIDYERHRGWSVVAHGTAREVVDEDELRQLSQSWEPQPWAQGARPLTIRLAWTEITGRCLGPFPQSHELPVDRLVSGKLKE